MRQSLKIMAAVLLFFGGTAFVAGAQSQAAESACKGLGQEPCQAQGCSWVKSHKRTNGKEIAAFCRKKPERKTTSAAVAPKS